ncbi:MAG: hypothetical protein A3G76_04510 [Acidobacteria bacterium RIFCSPLOWO2_12_FULL_65_11]|nr:MAG: hypothetical protein A3H95_11410 [Acidobacteria bacterium RIFCSPLOWO2_02_FULL_64_15]OFW28217.1 MAG: hypothetical protein A3G76_04510 [Acidobacteria bacterium RIFCSPLOWO2_12_FULL_65_11]
MRRTAPRSTVSPRKIPPSSESSPPRLISITEAARRLSISYWACRDLLLAGKLPGVRLPSPDDRRDSLRRLLVDAAALDAMIDELLKEPAASVR